MELFELVKLSKTDRKGPVFIEVCLDVTTQDRNTLIDSNIKYQSNSVLNEFEIIELMKNDKEIFGIKTNSRVFLVAKSYFDAISTYFKIK